MLKHKDSKNGLKMQMIGVLVEQDIGVIQFHYGYQMTTQK